jgi:hypothetical protein
MSDLRSAESTAQSDDALYRQIVLRAAGACAHWAVPAFTGHLDLALFPRGRGPIEQQIPYRVGTRVVERGVWRVMLCRADALPAGASTATRDAMLRAQIALSAAQMGDREVDHIVQCGLFGEVLHAWSTRSGSR